MEQEKQDYIFLLIARKLTGEATAEELQELEGLLKNNPELHYSLQTITDLWRHSGPAGQKQAEQAYARHQERMRSLQIEGLGDTETSTDQADENPGERHEGHRRRLIRNFAVFATVVFLAAVISIPLFRKTSAESAKQLAVTPPAALKEITTQLGARTSLSLPDGTKVRLNAGSTLTYPKTFETGDREVNLTGEGYFDVAKNPNRPFIIHTARVDIKVLGTTFNIKSYPTDRTTEATLIHGSIEVSIKARPNEKIILQPNEKLIVANDDSTLHRNASPGNGGLRKIEPLVAIRQPTYEPSTGAVVETSWIEDRLAFKDEEFGTLAGEMERWYGVRFVFTDPEQRSWQFSGSFPPGETIQQALDALKVAVTFDYTLHDGQVTIFNRLNK